MRPGDHNEVQESQGGQGTTMGPRTTVGARTTMGAWGTQGAQGPQGSLALGPMRSLVVGRPIQIMRFGI